MHSMPTFGTDRRMTVGILLFLDALSLLLGAVLAAWIRFLPQFFLQELKVILAHPGFILYAVGIQWALATTFDLYRPPTWRGHDELLVRMAVLALTLPIALTLGVYLVPAWRFGRGLLVLTLVIAIPLQLMGRLIWLAWGSHPPERNAVLVGDGPIVTSLLEELETRPWAPFRISLHIASRDLEEDPAAFQNSIDNADLLIVAALDRSDTTDRVTALNFRGTPVIDAAGAYSQLTGRIPVLQVDSRWFIATGDFSSLADSPFHHLHRSLLIQGLRVYFSLGRSQKSDTSVLWVSQYTGQGTEWIFYFFHRWKETYLPLRTMMSYMDTPTAIS